jgi:hypothetical protein
MAQPKAPRAGLAGRALRFIGGRAETSPWLPKDAAYPALAALDVARAGLQRQAGLYACWHLGVRPRWIRVGGHADLAVGLAQLQQRREIAGFDIHGGVYVAWAPVPRAALAGAVAFLAGQLAPLLQGLTIAGEVAPAATATAFPLPPGTRTPPLSP